MIVSRIRVQSGEPSFKKKSLVVIWFETNESEVCKAHVMAELVDMAYNFRVLVKTCHCLFALRNSGL